MGTYRSSKVGSKMCVMGIYVQVSDRISSGRYWRPERNASGIHDSFNWISVNHQNACITFTALQLHSTYPVLAKLVHKVVITVDTARSCGE